MSFSFFFNDPATTEIYTLSLHDALPISSSLPRPSPLVTVNTQQPFGTGLDRKSTRLNSSHLGISYAVFCLKKKKPLLRAKCCADVGKYRRITGTRGGGRLAAAYRGHGPL